MHLRPLPRPEGFCWHQLAARIAVLAGLCEEYDIWYHAVLE